MSWNDEAEWWDKRMGENGDWFNNQLVKPYIDDLFKTDLIKKSNNKILDIGCGNGHLSRYLSKFGNYVTAIDISEKMICMAKKYDTSNIEYIVGDIFLTCLDDKSFDLFVLNNVLQDTPNIFYIMKRIYELADEKSQVLIVIRHPCFHPKYAELGWLFEDNDKNFMYSGQGLTNVFDKLEKYKGIHFAMDDYFGCQKNERKWGSTKTVSYNRTLSYYIKVFLKLGFTIDDIVEPIPKECNTAISDLAKRIPIFIIFRLKVNK